MVHQAAGSMGSDCLEYILHRHPAGKKNTAMEYNNYFEKSLPLHYAVLASNAQNVRMLLKIMKSKPQAPDAKGKKDPQQKAFEKYKE